jgi:CBS domain containing-hemolysin-like protein
LDPASTLTIIWILLALIASAASAAQAVAGSIDNIESSLLAGQQARLRRLSLSADALGTLALVAAAAVAVVAIRDAGGDGAALSVGAGASVLLVRIAQEIAAWIARRNMERLAKPLLGDAAAFLPLIEPRPAQEPEAEREETVEQMVDAGEKAGLIESGEHEMISGVMGLDRTAVREIMVPRIDVVAVEVQVPLHSALDVIIGGAHSRLPVYEESIDHVVGLLYAKDILKILRDGGGKTDVPLRSLLRPAYFVPESKRVDELLQELQASKVHMAIVVDEYGGTAGIVTIEDILEEIVGEIQDEYDVGEEPLIERVGENEGIFNARVNVDEVNDALEVNLPEESDTLGGLVYQHLQKMPKVGDEVRVDGVTISVLSVLGRRIKKVRVSKLVEPTSTESAALDEEKATQ